MVKIFVMAMACLLVVAGCCVKSSQNNRLYYGGELQEEPFAPGIVGCLREMNHELPASPEAVEMYSRFKEQFPRDTSGKYERVLLDDLVRCPFTETEDFARLTVASILAGGTPVSEKLDVRGGFLRTFALKALHYSDEVVLQMAELVYAGRLSWHLSQMDALTFHFALVSRFGMTKVNELVSRIYRENGQVLVPPVLFREFVPSIISEVTEKVRNASPAEHKALLQSIAFGYTGRLMTSNETIREFYRAYPCRTYAHELVERGDFAVMADQDLWLIYSFNHYIDCVMSPVLMFEDGYRSYPWPWSGKCVLSRTEWARMQELGILTPGDLAARIGVTSISDYYKYMEIPEEVRTWLRLPFLYRNHPTEAVRLFIRFESRIPIEQVSADADLGKEMMAYLRLCTGFHRHPMEDPVLDLMMDEGLVPCKYFFPYFTCTYPSDPVFRGWNRVSWNSLSETNLASFLHFFGSELVWNESKLQFDWKDPAGAADIIANGVR